MKVTASRPKITVIGWREGTGWARRCPAAGRFRRRYRVDQPAQCVALASLPQRRSGHDPGRVAVDVAVTLADGGEEIGDLAVPRDQPDLFGPVVASDATPWHVSDYSSKRARSRSSIQLGPAARSCPRVSTRRSRSIRRGFGAEANRASAKPAVAVWSTPARGWQATVTARAQGCRSGRAATPRQAPALPPLPATTMKGHRTYRAIALVPPRRAHFPAGARDRAGIRPAQTPPPASLVPVALPGGLATS